MARTTQSNMDIRIEGIPELNHKLGVVMRGLQDIGAMQDIAQRAARMVRRFTPVRSGLLQSTIRGSKAKNKASVRVGSNKVPYAAVINYGWPSRKIEPSGFMQKADDAMKPLVPGLLDRAIKQIIRDGKLA